MKKLFRCYVKVFVFVISLLFMATNGMVVQAKEESSIFTEAEYEQLKKQLYFVYENISDFGLQKDLLDDLSVGKGIHSYECLNEGLVELDYLMYPIFGKGELIFFAIQKENVEGKSYIQLSEGMVAELSAYINSAERLALIYDSDCCYILTEESLIEVHVFSEKIDYRDEFRTEYKIEDVVYTQLKECEDIYFEYTLTSTRSNNAESAMVSVDYITQLPYSNLCWAAAIVCIGNCLTDYSYTVEEIAQSVHGVSDWNREASLVQTLDALENKYMIDYAYYNDSVAPTDGRIYSNIYRGYPLFGRWKWSGGHHLTVIRGIIMGTCVVVMDPEFGFITAYCENGTYSYVSSYSGVTLTLMGYASWFQHLLD